MVKAKVMEEGLTHLDTTGKARMVDISEKAITQREAVTRGVVYMKPETCQLILDNQIAKGDVFSAAKIAGIMAAKKTWDLIPLCHPLELTHIDLSFQPLQQGNGVEITATVGCLARTGVEMEALTAVSVAALTIYDMCKAVDKAMVISEIRLISKKGGRSGEYVRAGEHDRENYER
jgi:cyclic pyranopterin monophosphate synthase